MLDRALKGFDEWGGLRRNRLMGEAAQADPHGHEHVAHVMTQAGGERSQSFHAVPRLRHSHLVHGVGVSLDRIGEGLVDGLIEAHEFLKRLGVRRGLHLRPQPQDTGAEGPCIPRPSLRD